MVRTLCAGEKYMKSRTTTIDMKGSSIDLFEVQVDFFFFVLLNHI